MLLKYFFTLLFLFSFPLIDAQEPKAKIVGKVLTADQKPAEYININLQNTNYGTISDAQGNFQFEAPPGKYILEVFSIVAHRKEIPVTVRTDSINRFPAIHILEKSQDLEQVVVTAQLAPQSLNRSVYKVRVINAAQIQQRSPSNVESLLNSEIGVRMSNDGALGETDFEIMGTSGNNIKILVDGIPLIDRHSKKQSLSQIDVNNIERIEVVEGPLSVVYGTDALAGVINIITKKSRVGLTNPFTIGARIQEESSGKEYKPFHAKGIHIQNLNTSYHFKNGLYLGGMYTRNDFGGWQGNSQGRKKEWPAKIQNMPGGQIGWKKNNYDLLYKLDYLNEEISILGNIPDNQKATDMKFLSDRYTHQLLGEWSANHHLQLSLATSYQDYQRDKESTTIDFLTGEKYLSTEQNSQDESNYSTWFARTTAAWKASSKIHLQSGLEFQHNRSKGDKTNAAHKTITNGAFFFITQYSPFEAIDVRAGFRSSYNSAFRAPLLIPSLNTRFRFNEKLDLRLSYGRGFRAPTLQELYYTFYHVNGSVGFWMKGNPNLKAEKSDNYMASMVWRPIHQSDIRLTTTLSGFYNNFKDRIQMVMSSEESGTYTYYNTGKYRTLGLTLENSLVWNQLRALINFSYIGRYNTLKNQTSLTSQSQDTYRYSPELSASITYDWQKIATFNLFYKFTGARREYRVRSNELVLAGLDPYHWADFTISRPINKMLHIHGGIKNLFDVTWVKYVIDSENSGQSTASASSNLLGSGRSYFLGLTFKFNQ